MTHLQKASLLIKSRGKSEEGYYISSTSPRARIFPMFLSVTIGTNSSRTLTVVVVIAVTVIMECY